METHDTETDILSRIYESVMSFEHRLLAIESELKVLGANVTFLVKAYRSHQQRIGILEDEGTPPPFKNAVLKGV